MELTNTQRFDDSLLFPAGSLGIEIRGPAEPRAGQPLIVSGAFRIPEDEVKNIDPRPHRAIVIAVTRRTTSQSASPFRERLLFEDDTAREGTKRVGWFNADIFQIYRAASAGTYFVTASLGEYLSNTLEIEVK